MKKIIVFVVLTAAIFCGSIQAQNKTGYIRVDEMVSLMPELKKVDTALAIFQQDSLPRTYNYLLTQFQYYDSVAADSLRQTQVVRQAAAKSRTEFLSELQNWQNTAQSLIEAKQNALLQPIYEKVMKAINDVAKEKGYSYIYNREALLVAPPADDILPLVAAKLNVKLPEAKPPATTPAKTNNPPKTN